MFLIMSGAYIGVELESEFGKIPPSFLPLGNKRLFQYQISLAPTDSDVFISLPASFQLSLTDRDWLDTHGVTIIAVPDGLTLGASFVAAINICGHDLVRPLHILYGDTLYSELPLDNDIATVSKATGAYNWASISDDKYRLLHSMSHDIPEDNTIIDGYFKISKPRELIKYVTQCKWDFIDGLNIYHNKIGLKTVESIGWLDFGHVNTYYRSKAEFTTQRAFNELIVNPRWIEKSSEKEGKILAEANWFESIPAEVRGNTPQYLGLTRDAGKISYRLEYLHLTSLNELFVFSRLPTSAWAQILSSCVDFLSLCQKYTAKEHMLSNTLDSLFFAKTESRLQEYCLANNINYEQKWSFNGCEPLSIRDLIEESVNNLPKDSINISVLHGDFCFSNILYDFRAGKIKTIDPRGISVDGELTIYGDIRYDIAKLSHSILGLYDWIIAGYYTVQIVDDSITFNIADDIQHQEMQQIFINTIKDKFKLTASNLYAMQIQLFLSMLPLHSDDCNRQKALFANAFRLYQTLVRLEK